MKRYIDKHKCDGCQGRYLCVNDCVTSFIEVKQFAGGSFVDFKERGFCIDCGHCNAICPKGAVILESGAIETDDNLLRLFSMKRTVRKYNKGNEITKTELELIVSAGQSAPTEKNRGTVRICLVKKQLDKVFLMALETMKEHVERAGPLHPQYQQIVSLYEKKEPILWGAEYAVVIVGKTEFMVDGAIAAERMQLEAWSHGIASGYNGNLRFAINNNDAIKEIVGIKNHEEALVCFAMGHTDVQYCSPYISEKKKVLFI